ncbi:MAG: DUF1353 domain-containing protein [Cytophagales bacterium]|nr:DUF1353 domain-containing protein [Cytophagales bacterium]
MGKNVTEFILKWIFILVAAAAIIDLFPFILFLVLYVWVARKFLGVQRIEVTGKSKDYLYKIDYDHSYHTQIIQNVDVDFEFMKIKPSGESGCTINVLGKSNEKGLSYAWDGCSPKFIVNDLIIGTPDGRVDGNTGKSITHDASLIHDVLYQYHKELDKIVKRSQADRIFLEILEKNNFKLAKPYYWAVSAFGWSYWNT